MKRFTKFEKHKVGSYNTGSLLLNRAIGDCDGYPEGSIVEIYGWPGAGKTLLTYLAISEAQKQHPKKPCLLIDAENTFQFQQDWAESFGVDVTNLYVEKCSSAEEAFDILEEAILGEVERDKKGAIKKINPNDFACIVVDSVAQLVPLAEIEAKMDDSIRTGAQAGAMGRGLRKLQSALSLAKSKTTVFFVNQVRMAPTAYGNPETRPGGNALPFYATLIIRVTKDNKSIKRDEKTGKIISHDISVKIEKNKAGQIPEKALRFTLNYDGTGVDNDVELFDVGLLNGLIKQAGSYYYFVDKQGNEDEKIGRFYARKVKYIFEQFPEKKQLLLKLIQNNEIYTEELSGKDLEATYKESIEEDKKKQSSKKKVTKKK